MRRIRHDGVLVVGAGLAGLTAALSAAPAKALLLTGAPLNQGCSSAWARLRGRSKPGRSAMDARGAKRRGETSGIDAETNVPRALSKSIQPSAASSRYAASTVLRWTPSVAASVREPGSSSPARRRPRRMSSDSARAMRTNAGPAPSASTTTDQLDTKLV